MAEVPENVSYEMLQDLLRAERRSNKLMPMPARFWILTREFLATIVAEFRREQALDPFGRKVMLLTDQVKNARHAADSLWAVRERKIAMLALAATKDRKRPEALTPEEVRLYQDLVERLDAARGVAFEGLPQPAPALVVPSAAPAPVGPPIPIPPQVALPPTPQRVAAAPVAPGPVAALAPASLAKPTVVPADTKAGANAEMVTVRALMDIPPFVGPDMQTYFLKSGDIASVPPSIANILVMRKKASVLDA